MTKFTYASEYIRYMSKVLLEKLFIETYSMFNPLLVRVKAFVSVNLVVDYIFVAYTSVTHLEYVWTLTLELCQLTNTLLQSLIFRFSILLLLTEKNRAEVFLPFERIFLNKIVQLRQNIRQRIWPRFLFGFLPVSFNLFWWFQDISYC